MNNLSMGILLPAAKTLEQKSSDAKRQRDNLLLTSDWTQLLDVPASTKDKWTAYRQALRDLSQQDSFPSQIIWPTTPV